MTCENFREKINQAVFILLLMIGRSKEGQIYSPIDVRRAMFEFLENGTIPHLALGEVIWSPLRPYELKPASDEEIIEHNTAVLEKQNEVFQAKNRRPLAVRVGAAALSMVASIVR